MSRSKLFQDSAESSLTATASPTTGRVFLWRPNQTRRGFKMERGPHLNFSVWQSVCLEVIYLHSDSWTIPKAKCWFLFGKYILKNGLQYIVVQVALELPFWGSKFSGFAQQSRTCSVKQWSKNSMFFCSLLSNRCWYLPHWNIPPSLRLTLSVVFFGAALGGTTALFKAISWQMKQIPSNLNNFSKAGVRLLQMLAAGGG